MLSIEDFEIKRKAESEIELKQRRERIATEIMAGIMACPDSCDRRPDYVVIDALKFTDALIKALDEVKP